MKNIKFLIAVFYIMLFAMVHPVSAYFIQWNDDGYVSDYEGETTADYNSSVAPRWGFVNPSSYVDKYNLGWDGVKWPTATYPRTAIICKDGTARQGNCYMSLTSYPGDSAYGSTTYDSNDRAGVQNTFNDGNTSVDIADNPDIYFGFSHRLPTSTIMQSNEWLMIGAFSTSGQNLQSVGGIGLMVQFAPGRLDINYGTSPTAEKIETIINPYVKGVWHDYILRVKYSNTNTGLIQLWHRQEGSSEFTKIFNKTNIRTNNVAVPSGTNTMLYWQQTLYRGPDVPVIQASHFDNNHVATTFDEIRSTFDGGSSNTNTTAPTCTDGIKNQGETGVDCGGPCAACSSNSSATQLALKPGWNQISSPVAAGISLATIEANCTILPYKSQKLWAWNAGAQAWANPAKIEPFRGHWIYAAYQCTVPLSGASATFSSLPLSVGWNKISASGALSAIAGTCVGHITGNWVWNWDKATEKWVHPTAMQLDKGYWIKVDQICVLGA